MTFADKLRELRTAANLEREGLAQASGLSRGVIRDYEQGKRMPTLESAFKLARALGVSVEVFEAAVTGGIEAAPAKKTRPAKRTATPSPATGRPRKSK